MEIKKYYRGSVITVSRPVEDDYCCKVETPKGKLLGYSYSELGARDIAVGKVVGTSFDFIEEFTLTRFSE